MKTTDINEECTCQDTSWHKTGREDGYSTDCKNKAKFRVKYRSPVRDHLPDIDKKVCGTHLIPYKKNRWNIFRDIVIEELK